MSKNKIGKYQNPNGYRNLSTHKTGQSACITCADLGLNVFIHGLLNPWSSFCHCY